MKNSRGRHSVCVIFKLNIFGVWDMGNTWCGVRKTSQGKHKRTKSNIGRYMQDTRLSHMVRHAKLNTLVVHTGWTYPLGKVTWNRIPTARQNFKRAMHIILIWKIIFKRKTKKTHDFIPNILDFSYQRAELLQRLLNDTFIVSLCCADSGEAEIFQTSW